MHKLGVLLGPAINFVEGHLLRGALPITLRDRTPDHAEMQPAEKAKPIPYPKPDGLYSFDRPTSVYLSNTNHEEDQPCHLQLADDAIPIGQNLPQFDEPAQRYCPVGVYEVVQEDGKDPRFVINAQNCIHCKTATSRTRRRTSPGSRPRRRGAELHLHVGGFSPAASLGLRAEAQGRGVFAHIAAAAAPFAKGAGRPIHHLVVAVAVDGRHQAGAHLHLRKALAVLRHRHPSRGARGPPRPCRRRR